MFQKKKMTFLAYQKAFAYENFTWDNTSVSMGKEHNPAQLESLGLGDSSPFFTC